MSVFLSFNLITIIDYSFDWVPIIIMDELNKNKRKADFKPNHTKVTITDFFKKKSADVMSKFSFIKLFCVCCHNIQ